jgi:hypothetical protein
MRQYLLGGTFIGFYRQKTSSPIKERIVKTLTTIAVVCLSVIALGCGQQSNSNVATTNQNTVAPVNQNSAPVNSANASAVPADAAVGSLATPTDAYKTAYALREKKDVAGLRKVMSKDVIEFLSMIAEEEGTTVDAKIAELFGKPQWKVPETRNEKISGDRATVEYIDEDGKYKTMDFVREGQEWKLSLPSREDATIETGPPGKRAN